MTATVVQQESKATSKAKDRIIGYDFARSLAILGMILVNFKLVLGASKTGSDVLVWSVGLLEGRAAATFVVLAGVGLSLLSRRSREQGSTQERTKTRRQIWKRALFLFVFGLLYSPIWPPDILHFYGIYLAFGAMILYVPDRHLWRWAGGFTVIFAVMMIVFNYETGWDFDALEYLDFWTPAGMIRHLFFNGFHPVFPWTAFLIAGMWLGRQDVRNSAVRQSILIRSGVILIMSEVASAILIRLFSPSMGTDIAEALFTRNMMPPMPLYILSGGATAMIVIVLCIAFTERVKDAKWIQPFVAVGQLALTVYVAHVILGMGIMEAMGWLNSDQTLVFAVTYSFVFYFAMVIFAHLWRQSFKRGPVEWLMRQLTD